MPNALQRMWERFRIGLPMVEVQKLWEKESDGGLNPWQQFPDEATELPLLALGLLRALKPHGFGCVKVLRYDGWHMVRIDSEGPPRMKTCWLMKEIA